MIFVCVCVLIPEQILVCSRCRQSVLWRFLNTRSAVAVNVYTLSITISKLWLVVKSRQLCPMHMTVRLTNLSRFVRKSSFADKKYSTVICRFSLQNLCKTDKRELAITASEPLYFLFFFHCCLIIIIIIILTSHCF